MKLQIVSDLHLEFDQSYQAQGYDFFILPRTDADVIVLAGDVWYGLRGIDWAAEVARSHDKPVIMVFGNHDYWGERGMPRYRIETVLRKGREVARAYRKQGTDLWLLNDSEAVIDGVRFLGTTLWTDYRGGDTNVMWQCRRTMNDFVQIPGRPAPVALYQRHRNARRWLWARLRQGHDGQTVVVTHHAPWVKASAGIYSYVAHDPVAFAYGTDLEELLVTGLIDLWIHGHNHECLDAVIGATRVVANPRGYMPYDITRGFEPARVVALRDS